jgi:hypothetical protein
VKRAWSKQQRRGCSRQIVSVVKNKETTSALVDFSLAEENNYWAATDCFKVLRGESKRAGVILRWTYHHIPLLEKDQYERI